MSAADELSALRAELELAREARDIAREELAHSRATADWLLDRVEALGRGADARLDAAEALMHAAVDERDRLRATVEELRFDLEREVRLAEERGAYWAIIELPHAGRPGMVPEVRARAAVEAGRARRRPHRVE